MTTTPTTNPRPALSDEARAHVWAPAFLYRPYEPGRSIAIHCDLADLARLFPNAKPGDAEIERLYDALRAAKTGAEKRAIEDEIGAAVNLTAEGRYFGVLDSKNRSIGAEVCTFERNGRYFMDVRAKRAGQNYGASQQTREFTSAEDRAKAVERYWRDAQARAMRAK